MSGRGDGGLGVHDGGHGSDCITSVYMCVARDREGMSMSLYVQVYEWRFVE